MMWEYLAGNKPHLFWFCCGTFGNYNQAFTFGRPWEDRNERENSIQVSGGTR